MDSSKVSAILRKMLEQIELPGWAYEKAVGRYNDLGEWFSRPASLVSQYDPHIYSQGSTRLGIANKPIAEGETYDVDLGCKLRQGITMDTHTQKDLKDLVGQELEAYRKARGIESKLEAKHRCWRLPYKDEMSFHLDAVPSIPAKKETTKRLTERLVKGGLSEAIASAEIETTSVITDDRHRSFAQICDDWKISNSEGYAKWFERRLDQNTGRRDLLEKAQVDKIPLFKRKAALQEAIQLLKRHRDKMFIEDSEAKPISVIITTLAGHAYSGEQDLASALTSILQKMEGFIQASHPKVPNPVDPDEDFADRWAMPDCAHLKLETNFYNWMKQVKIDFQTIFAAESAIKIKSIAENKFAVNLSETSISEAFCASPLTESPNVQVISNPAQPWSPKNS